MLKRTIFIILAVFLVIIAIVAFCKKPAGKKLVFWSIQLKPIYEKQINSIINDFESNHPDCKIVWVDIPIQEAQKRTLASILSSTPPDLINLNPDFSVILAQRNALEFFEEEETQQYHKGLLEKLKYNGKIYALPFYATSPVTIYNKTVFDKCSQKAPVKTYDELYSISKKLKNCQDTPFAANLNENDTLAKVLNKYNVSSLETKEEKENTKKVFKTFNDMYKEGLMPKDTLTINHREVIEKYMSKQTAVIVAGSNFINMIKQNAQDVYRESAISTQLTGKNKKFDVSLMNLIIPKKAKNKELAKEFALQLTNEKNQLELSKLTNVLPANKKALENNYFKKCSDDLVDKSRCESVRQLNNINTVEFSQKNKKLTNEEINKALEEILLDENADDEVIEQKTDLLSRILRVIRN